MPIDMQGQAVRDFLVDHEQSSLTKNGVPLTKSKVFLFPEKNEQTISYIAKSQLDSDISDYAFERLKEIADNLKYEPSKHNREKLIKIGASIRQDFETENAKKGVFANLWNKLLVGLGFRHSEKEISEKMAFIARQENVPQFEGCISLSKKSACLHKARAFSGKRRIF